MSAELSRDSSALAVALHYWRGGLDLTPREVDTIREHFRICIRTMGDDGAMLREALDRMSDRADVSRWVDCALEMGIDPLL